MLTRRPAPVVLALAAAFLAGSAADRRALAQAPSSALPASAKAVVRPDLAVTIDAAGVGFPNTFTVRNVGNADSKVCVLKVTAAFVPPVAAPATPPPFGPCPGLMTQEQCDAIMKLLGQLEVGGTYVDPKVACGAPFAEFVEAVLVLKPGESKTFTRGSSAATVVMPGGVRPVAQTQVTHVKKCAPVLVCAYDITAKVDATNDNQEVTKANNTATRRASREIHVQ